MKLASHVAWYLEYGTWPARQLNHTCDNGVCVRHHHLYDGTQAENMRDMAERGTCPAGHPRTPEHLQVRADGTRYCKTCENAKRRARRAVRKGTTMYEIIGDNFSNHNLPIGAHVEPTPAPDWAGDGTQWYTQGGVGDEVAIDPRDLKAV